MRKSVGANGRGHVDAGFGDQLNLIAERRIQFERFSDGIFRGVVAIDLGRIKGRDAQLHAGFHEAQRFLRSSVLHGDAHGALYDAGKVNRFGKVYSFHVYSVHKKENPVTGFR